jgi:hypothetical protein
MMRIARLEANAIGMGAQNAAQIFPIQPHRKLVAPFDQRPLSRMSAQLYKAIIDRVKTINITMKTPANP